MQKLNSQTKVNRVESKYLLPQRTKQSIKGQAGQKKTNQMTTTSHQIRILITHNFLIVTNNKKKIKVLDKITIQKKKH